MSGLLSAQAYLRREVAAALAARAPLASVCAMRVSAMRLNGQEKGETPLITGADLIRADPQLLAAAAQP